MRDRSPRVIYFRRRKSQAENFLVFVEKGAEEYCCPFEELEEALQFMDEEQKDLAVVCTLFQQLPVLPEELSATRD